MVKEHNKLTLINNINKEDMFLKKKMAEVSIQPKELANKLHVNPVTVHRWLGGERNISVEMSVEIAKIIKCDPREILFPAKKISDFLLKYYIDNDFYIKKYSLEDQTSITVPYEWYHKDLKAIQVNIPGTFLHREVFLFDMPKRKNYFSQNAINKLCFIKCSTGSKHEMIGIIKTNTDGTLKIINPLTRNVLNKKAESFLVKDIQICVPIKAKFDPDSINKIDNI